MRAEQRDLLGKSVSYCLCTRHARTNEGVRAAAEIEGSLHEKVAIDGHSNAKNSARVGPAGRQRPLNLHIEEVTEYLSRFRARAKQTSALLELLGHNTENHPFLVYGHLWDKARERRKAEELLLQL